MFVLPGYCWGKTLTAFVFWSSRIGLCSLRIWAAHSSFFPTGPVVHRHRIKSHLDPSECTKRRLFMYWKAIKSWNWQNSGCPSAVPVFFWPKWNPLNFFNNPLLPCVSGGPEGRGGKRYLSRAPGTDDKAPCPNSFAPVLEDFVWGHCILHLMPVAWSWCRIPEEDSLTHWPLGPVSKLSFGISSQFDSSREAMRAKRKQSSPRAGFFWKTAVQ